MVRVGLTPPVAPVLGPHLRQLSARETPEVVVELRRMWLPSLTALAAGDIDVAIACALVPEQDGIVTEVFCGEPLLVGVRPDHRLAAGEHIALADLAHDVLGLTPPSLFPAWALAQQQALAAAGVHPPTTELDDPDLTASRWADQPEVAWVLLIGSLTSTHTSTVLRPADPPQLVPFVLQWNPDRAHTMAVARFVHTALTGELPPGWLTQPGHLRHTPGLPTP